MLTLRPASLSDANLLEHWAQQSHVIAAIPDVNNDWEIELQHSSHWSEQLIAEKENRAIGFIRIINPARDPDLYWGEMPEGYRAIDIWIGEESDLGKGYGTKMMELAIEKCFSDKKVNTIIIDPLASNKSAHRFYERLGFRFVEERRFGEDDCLVYQFERKKWNQAKS
jgi:aminoglycoside 6'-N-acetyltransferase